jgi:hypothetical protein
LQSIGKVGLKAFKHEAAGDLGKFLGFDFVETAAKG